MRLAVRMGRPRVPLEVAMVTSASILLPPWIHVRTSFSLLAGRPLLTSFLCVQVEVALLAEA